MAKKTTDPKLIKALAEARAKKGPKVVKAFSTAAAEKETVKLVNKLVKGGTQGSIKLLSKGTATPQELVQLLVDKVEANVAYLKTYVDTGLSVIGRERIAEESRGLNANWYRYIGGTIATSRDFCIERDGGYFTQADVEDWADPETNPDYPWDGMIEGTDPGNIFTYCGGWNCRHELIPVLDAAVPEDVKAFNEAQRKEAEATQERLVERAAETPEETAMKNIRESLRGTGYSEEEIERILGGEVILKPAAQTLVTTAPEVVNEAKALTGFYTDLQADRTDANLDHFVSNYNESSQASRELFITEQARKTPEDITQQDAAMSYVRRGYKNMNELSRGNIDPKSAYWVEVDLPKTAAEVKQMDDFIAATASPVDSPVLWRGVPNDVSDDLKVGSMFIDRGFVSTTKDRSVALSFTDQKSGKLLDEVYRTIFKLETDAATRGVDVDAGAFGTHQESEVILKRSSRFVITGETFEELPYPYNQKARILTIKEVR